MVTYINSLPRSVDQVTLYSDTCGGQNKNRIFAAAMVYSLQENPHIKRIDQKFMVSGHSEMEVDSMHAAIEFAKKGTEVNIPKDWENVCRLARRKKPYVVVPVRNSDILNLNDLIRIIDINLQNIPWRQVKWLRYIREGDNVAILHKTDSLNGEFVAAATKKTRRSASRAVLAPTRAYEDLIPISAAKKKDLVTLCQNGTISREYHSYYQALPSISAEDRLPEPNDSDEDEDE